MKHTCLFILSLILFLASSCEKQDDFSKIKNDYNYTASFSVPIGHGNFGLAEAAINIPSGFPDFPDTLGYYDFILFEHSMAFDYEKMVLDTTKIEALHFAIVLYSDFPATASFQLYLANADTLKIDSLFIDGSQIIEAAKIDTSGNLITQGYYFNADIPVTREKCSNWNNVTQVIVSGYLNNEDHTKKYEYYNNYKVSVELGVRVDFNFKIRDL
jgi:hypothetical protein